MREYKPRKKAATWNKIFNVEYVYLAGKDFKDGFVQGVPIAHVLCNSIFIFRLQRIVHIDAKFGFLFGNQECQFKGLQVGMGT